MNIPPARRTTDSRYVHLRAFKIWWQSGWGLLFQALWLLFITAVVAAAVVSYAIDQHHAAQTARAGCERTRDLGPYAVKDFERRHVYPPKQLAIAKATIPKTCP